MLRFVSFRSWIRGRSFKDQAPGCRCHGNSSPRDVTRISHPVHGYGRASFQGHVAQSNSKMSVKLDGNLGGIPTGDFNFFFASQVKIKGRRSMAKIEPAWVTLRHVLFGVWLKRHVTCWCVTSFLWAVKTVEGFWVGQPSRSPRGGQTRSGWIRASWGWRGPNKRGKGERSPRPGNVKGKPGQGRLCSLYIY